MEKLDMSLYIALKVPDGYSFFKFDEIVRFEAIQKRTLVYMIYSDKPIKLLNCMTDIVNKLSSHKEFFKCHRSHIVSLVHIEKYIKKQRILVTNNGNASIAKVHTKRFEESYCK
jgi:DNA-binding LytR/AlgR family response regulator